MPLHAGQLDLVHRPDHRRGAASASEYPRDPGERLEHALEIGVVDVLVRHEPYRSGVDRARPDPFDVEPPEQVIREPGGRTSTLSGLDAATALQTVRVIFEHRAA